ncbi:MAG: hypothetical protein LBJ38_02315 [Oscillospiraceae bacterium]|jgi:hypothetical protein|nr:hypothetical protein [Oscillospiraceae bacterium]
MLSRRNKNSALASFARANESCPHAIDEVDERLWTQVVDTVAVMRAGSMMFRFCAGIEICQEASV